MILRIFSNGGLTVIGRALTLATTVFVARMLGPAEYGRYAVALTLLVIATFPAMSGLPDLVVRQVAARGHGDDKRSLWAIVRPTLELAALMSAALMAIYFASLPFAQRMIAEYDQELALLALAVIPFFVLRTLLGAVMRGLDRVAMAIVPTELIHPALFMALLFIIQPTDAPHAFYALAGAFVISALVAVLMTRTQWPKEPPHVDQTPLKRGYLFRAGLPFAAIGVLALINQRIDLLVLGAFAPAREIGLYGLAVQLALIAQLPMVIANGVISSQIAVLYQRSDRAGLESAMRQVSGLLSLVGLAGFLIFCIAGRWLITFAFGAEFTGAYTYVLILLAGQMFHLACGPVGVFLNLTGHERETLRGVALSAVVALVFCLALVPFFGGTGAAVASFLGMASLYTYLSLRVWRVLGIAPGLATLFAGHRRPTK